MVHGHFTVSEQRLSGFHDRSLSGIVGSPAAMRIDLSAAPHRVDDLLRFLRMTGYLAHEVDYAIIEIDDDALPASSFGVAPMALALRLRVWNEVNGAEARLVEAALPLEP